jgi:uncharacterized protein YegP (UPF0339 family)
MSKKYQVYQDVAGKYRFRLRAENNKIVAVSQGYSQHASCMNGVESVQKNCNAAIEDITTKGLVIPNPKFQVYSDVSGEYRFRLIAANGEEIAASEGYQAKEGCLNGIAAVKSSCDAEIEDLTAAGKVAVQVAVVPKVTAALIEPQVPIAVATVEGSGVGSVETKLELTSMPEKATKGDIVSFKGKLTESATGKGIPYAVIDLFERDRSFLNDEWLGDAGTREDGSFTIDWKVRKVDWWDNTAEIYARFYRHITAQSSKSTNYKIKIQ